MSILFLVRVTVFGLVGFAGLSFLLIIIGGLIPVNRTFKNNAEGITIYLSSNGMHTDFILPICHEQFDWEKIIDLDQFAITNRKTGYLGIGWGDRAIYLELTDWAELKPGLALKTLFWPTPTILHVKAYDELPGSDPGWKYFHSVTISSGQYLALCEYILDFFQLDAGQKTQLVEGKGYTDSDNFYEAAGTYHLFSTCNTWISCGLEKIGVRTAFWAPTDRAIFYQLQQIKGSVN